MKGVNRMKRILSITIILSLLISAVSFADSGASVPPPPNTAIAGNIITVSGTALYSGKTVTLLLIKGGSDLLQSLDTALQDGGTPDLNGSISFFGETLADSSGNYTFIIEMPAEAGAENYRAIAGGSALGGQTAETEFHYEGISRFLEGINAINGAQTAEDMKSVLSAYGSYFQLDTAFLQNEKVLRYVCEELTKQQYSAEVSQIPATSAKLQNDYDMFLVYAMLNFEDSTIRLEAFLEAKQELLQIDFNAYRNLDRDSQAEVLANIVDFTCTDIGQFSAAFSDFLLLAELNHAGTWSILADTTEKNQTQIGFDPSLVSGYSKKRSAGYKAMKDVLTKTKISTLPAYAEKLYEIFQTINLPGGGTPSGSVGSGGSSGTPSHPGGVTVPVSTPAPTAEPTQPPEPQQRFTDISGHWAEQDILYLEKNGLISGKTETQFMPEDLVTRAEFAVLIWRAAGEKQQEYKNIFFDVSESAWYVQAAESLSSEGIINGYDGMFSPEQFITREEMAKMIVCAYEVFVKPIEDDSQAIAFLDENKISGWSLPYIRKACSAGLLSGVPGENGVWMYPRNHSTRAEATKMVRLFYDSILL